MNMKKIVLLYLFGVLTGVTACQDNNDLGEKEGNTSQNLSGYAQKGQLIKGSQITAFSYDTGVNPTGESFPANISDYLGHYSINANSSAPYFEVRAEGYFFNELSGDVSESPLYLEAFVGSNSNNANINLMTTTIKNRVKKLVKSGHTIDQALSKAQGELLSSLGMTDTGEAFHKMDITGISDADAQLLAFALMVQRGRTVSSMLTLTQKISSELEENGALTPSTISAIKEGDDPIDTWDVLDKMADYYKEHSLAITQAPAFYKYTDVEFFDSGFKLDSDEFDEDNNKYVLNILSVYDFSVSADNASAQIEKKHLLGPAYSVTVTIPLNEAFEEKKTTLQFTDGAGKDIDSYVIHQQGNTETLCISGAVGNGRDPFVDFGKMLNNCMINVNGEQYTVDNQGWSLSVSVPKADSYFFAYPADMVNKESDGVFLFTIPATCNGKLPDVILSDGASTPFVNPFIWFGMSGPDSITDFTAMPHSDFVISEIRLGESYLDSWRKIKIISEEGLPVTGSIAYTMDGEYYLNNDYHLHNIIISYEERAKCSELTVERDLNQDYSDGIIRFYAFFPKYHYCKLKFIIYGINEEVLVDKTATRTSGFNGYLAIPIN